MTGIPLYLVQPTGTCRLALRRYRHDENEHSHDATVIVDEDAAVTERREDGRKGASDRAGRVPRGDPRWPANCGCGEPFAADDTRQVNELDWYEGGGQRFAWGIGSWDGPAGAVMRTPWRDCDSRPSAWHICLPNGTWWNTNDHASRDEGSALGPYWEVTGEAPLLTVSPSINDTSSRPWHGWIRAGVLEPA